MAQKKQSTHWLLRIVCQCEIRYRPVPVACVPAQLSRVSKAACPVCRQRFCVFFIAERRLRNEGPPRGGERRRDTTPDVQTTVDRRRVPR